MAKAINSTGGFAGIIAGFCWDRNPCFLSVRPKGANRAMFAPIGFRFAPIGFRVAPEVFRFAPKVRQTESMFSKACFHKNRTSKRTA